MNIVITGASSGIGFEAALSLIVSNEHRVVAIARNKENLRRLLEIARGLNPQCQLLPVQFDLVHDDYQEGLVPFLREHVGQVDVLINNAGALINKAFLEQEDEDFERMFQTNVLAPVKMIRNLYPLMQAGSHILNIGSMGGFQGSVKFPGLSSYSASKAALHVLTECLAAEFAEKGIRINCLALGSAQTEMLEAAFPEYKAPVEAYEMGQYVADFALSGHKFFNGKIIPVALTTP